MGGGGVGYESFSFTKMEYLFGVWFEIEKSY